jgi:hypothetical protein
MSAAPILFANFSLFYKALKIEIKKWNYQAFL